MSKYRVQAYFTSDGSSTLTEFGDNWILVSSPSSIFPNPPEWLSVAASLFCFTEP